MLIAISSTHTLPPSPHPRSTIARSCRSVKTSHIKPGRGAKKVGDRWSSRHAEKWDGSLHTQFAVSFNSHFEVRHSISCWSETLDIHTCVQTTMPFIHRPFWSHLLPVGSLSSTITKERNVSISGHSPCYLQWNPAAANKFSLKIGTTKDQLKQKAINGIIISVIYILQNRKGLMPPTRTEKGTGGSAWLAFPCPALYN